MKTSRIKIDKKISKVLIYTLLVFSMISFASFSKSYSKYIDNENNALVYASKLYTLTKDNLVLSYTNDSTNRVINVTFNLPRNNVGIGNSKDTYKVTIPEKCTYITVPNYNRKINGNVAEISFTSATQGKTNRFVFSCKIDDLKVSNPDFIDIKVSVKEKILNEAEFLYNSGRLTMDYKTYEENVPEDFTGGVISENKKSLVISETDTNLITIFNNWVKEYANTYATGADIDRIIAYAATIYKTSADVSELDASGNAVNKLKGINVSYNKETKTYSFEATDNLLGYAKTYNSNRNPIAGRPSSLYFTTNNKDDIKDIFEYYLNTYIYKDEEKTKEVIDYINLFSSEEEGINYIITEGNEQKIKGIRYYPLNKEVRLNTKDTLYDYAHQVANSPIRLTIEDKNHMYDKFKDLLVTSYGGIVSETMVSEITKVEGDVPNYIVLHPVLKSILKNNLDDSTSARAFTEYYNLYDEVNKHYLLIRSFSFANEFNYMEINPLKYNKDDYQDLEIEFNNNVDLDISVTRKLTRTETMTDEEFTLLEEEYKNSMLEIANTMNIFFTKYNEDVDPIVIDDILTEETVDPENEKNKIITYTLEYTSTRTVKS